MVTGERVAEERVTKKRERIKFLKLREVIVLYGDSVKKGKKEV